MEYAQAVGIEIEKKQQVTVLDDANMLHISYEVENSKTPGLNLKKPCGCVLFTGAGAG